MTGAGTGGGAAAGEGRLLGGRYRLVERIGSGGMGTVWRAHDELVGRDCAVKEPRLLGDPAEPAAQRLYARLRREARAAARVEHPAAVAVHDVVMDGGVPCIVMELVRGESLHERLKRGALPPAETARIGLAIAGALGAAHAKGIVHRDVKPANVLLGPHGQVVLTDFGIARIQGEEPLTVSGEFVGSLESIAPERMQGVPAGPESDLWSLGVLLYAAVEGWSPFRRTTLESTLAAILQAEPPKPVRAGPLSGLIVRLLAKDPGDRPAVAEVEGELSAVSERSAEDSETVVLTGGSTPGASVPRAPSSAGGPVRPDVVDGSAGVFAPDGLGVEPTPLASAGERRPAGVGTSDATPAASAGEARPGAFAPGGELRSAGTGTSDATPAASAGEARREGRADGPGAAPMPAASAGETGPGAFAPGGEPRPARAGTSDATPAASAGEARPAGTGTPDPTPSAPAGGPGAEPPVSGRGGEGSRPAAGVGRRRTRYAIVAGAVAASATLGFAVWAAARDSTSPPSTGRSTNINTTPIPTPDSWRWRPHFESRLDAEISVPASYKREPVTSQKALASDKEITFEERGNPVWVELIRGEKDTENPIQWAQRELAWLKQGGPRGGEFTANEAKGSVHRANHHGVDAAVLDVTYFAQEGDTARPVHRLAFYVVTDAGERYTVLVEMPQGGKEEAEGQDLFRGVRDRLKLGKAETSP
ncbi:protein kinase [Streptomyces sp. NPDC020681]|uniref:serine/threonine-protein kinase n=1 Tax=Streptomyces sp. NPDC020681 TaxID=3365083 RepID=UPI0037BABF7A